MGRISIAVPSIKEQGDALSRIGEETDPLNTTISRLEREIELFREYRIRLVADVVTGKLDVRDAARRLPDAAIAGIELEPDDPELIDEEATGA